MNRLVVAAVSVVFVNVAAVPAGSSLFLGKSAEAWRKDLSDADASVRRSAAFALGRMGEEARGAVPHLVRRLQEDTDAGVRDMAASAIGDIARSIKYSNATLWERSGGMLVQITSGVPKKARHYGQAAAMLMVSPSGKEKT
jgi:hypothetical protein